MSFCQTTPRIIAPKKVLEKFQHVTINGGIEFDDPCRVARIAWAYREVVRRSIKYLFEGKSVEELVKALYNILPNYIYLETALKQARAIVEGLLEKEVETGRVIHAEIKRMWFANRGNKFDGGNRNIRIHVRENHVVVKIRDPWGGWLEGRAFFGERYIPLLKELEELAGRREESYGVVISFREHPRIHVQIPLHLYLKHFSTPKPPGYGLVAGFDLNSDRINVIVIDRSGNIVSLKTLWFSEATRPGFPREKAGYLRLNALGQAIKYVARIGADYVAFENLYEVKRKRFTENPTANRKISKFAKRQLLLHGILRSLREGLHVVLVDPRGTTNSKEHDEVMKRHGLDRHTASAYLVALRALSKVDINQHKHT
ncbi:MAG: hypothetical protein QW387_02190 [Desulfurococcus sp.]|uniref:hypothetical protein n=1 Tax=Desulfurococcus sp. TaxID=51678 RepID=UPI003161BCEC